MDDVKAKLEAKKKRLQDLKMAREKAKEEREKKSGVRIHILYAIVIRLIAILIFVSF